MLDIYLYVYNGLTVNRLCLSAKNYFLCLLTKISGKTNFPLLGLIINHFDIIL